LHSDDATKFDVLASQRLKDGDMTETVKLLEDRRKSALIDALAIEMRLACFSEKPDPAGIKSNLSSVGRMFKEYAATLEDSIHSKKLSEN
jgi:hypothetical protein